MTDSGDDSDTTPSSRPAAPGAQPPRPLFGDDSQFHRFFNDPRWALAVVRATVLEAAHPQIGAALTDNSAFVAHPWRRLSNTLLSLQRMFGADEQVRRREAARLNRLHARFSGTDAHDRPYDAMDPDVRAWVVATLFESSVTMYRLSGQPLEQAVMERLYAEFRAFLAALQEGQERQEGTAGAADAAKGTAKGAGKAAGKGTGKAAGKGARKGAARAPADLLPATLPEFWRYYDRMVEETLEDTEAMRIILYKLFDHLPAPPLLGGLPTVWAAGRALAGPVIGTITVASLPEPFRRRAGLPDVPGARTLMQGAYTAVGLARFLPENWLSTESLYELLALSPDGDDPRSATLAALHERVKRAGAFLRLVVPFPAQRDAATDGSPRRSAAEFFREVLDQTGNGYLDWPDLAAMARELATRLDLDEPAESRLYAAYAQWWRELQEALDTDGDGRISEAEYAAAVPALAGPGLIRVAEVLFEVTDANGDQSIDADEYRALFRTGFRRTMPDAGGIYSRSAFVRDFLSFMSGRRRSTPYDPLLADA